MTADPQLTVREEAQARAPAASAVVAEKEKDDIHSHWNSEMEMWPDARRKEQGSQR